MSGRLGVMLISVTDPWSVWSMSGITRLMCAELQRRGLLEGAIGVNGGCGRALRHPPPSWKRLLHKLDARRRRGRARQRWEHESEGRIGAALRRCPSGTAVVYCFVTPECDDELDVQRFRLLDLSLFDAVRHGAFGYAGLRDDQVAKRAEGQRAALATAEGVVTASTYAADSISRDFGYPREKITPIGFGPAVEVAPLGAWSDERYCSQRILFVGRDWERKNGPLLLDAFRDVRRSFPRATLVVGGPPSLPTDEPGVEFHPPIDKGTRAGRRKLAALYASSSLFCMPSECEPWGLVYVEAQQHEAPVVGFHRWALPDIVEDGVTGLLTRDYTANGLAEILRTALSDPHRLAIMGRAATERVRRVLDWPHVVDRLLYRVLPDALEGREPVWMQPEQIPSSAIHQ